MTDPAAYVTTLRQAVGQKGFPVFPSSVLVEVADDQSYGVIMTTAMRMRTRIGWLLDYEPTWFPEMSSGLGILLWSINALLTPDYRVSGDALIVPALGALLGPTRWMLLFRVRYAPRVAAAFGGGIWWTWIICSAVGRWGIAPMVGPMTALLVLDILTLARFSIPCFRDLLADVRGWRGAR